ncbi:MAG TPA: NAD(P)-dependent oxidoreductase [Xanthobacteraceae bacterium]|nr:NAD(P)-dependent oxidoreductase [Xanthobacteraceae bacterium]
MSDKSPVGVIGTGLMGEVFARRLAGAGFGVVGYDVDAAKSARLEEFGARPAAAIADVVRAARVIVLAVFNTDQVEQVVEQEIVPAIPEQAATSDKVVLCTSTCDPDRVAALAARIAGQPLEFLETPVSGTSEQVRQGAGVGLIGGDAAVAAEAEVDDVLQVLFPKRFHVGAAGDGGRTKLAVNLILGLNRLALAEGLVFATRLGLDPTAFLKVAQASAAYSQVMDTKGAKMIARDFRPEGRARQTLKDVHLMLDQARKIGQPLPLLSVNADVLESCVRAGEADLDNSVIVEEIRRRGTKM